MEIIKKPRAVFRDATEAVRNAFDLNHIDNLMDLPTPFHGNHPQYNKYVTKQLGNLKDISQGSIQTLQQDLSNMINSAYKNYQNTGENLNEYFRKFN